jgi:TP901 family phage tail tape measure protein
MASVDRIIEILFQGADNVSGVISGIEGRLEGLGKTADTVGDVTKPFADLATGILKVEAALAALALGGLAFAYSKSKDFESASIDLQKVLGDNTDKLGEAEQNATDLSNAYGVASTEILQSTANFKQAGFSIEDAMTLAKDSLDLVIAGEVSASESSDILVRSLKGFGEPASEAGRLIDILNGVSNEYATNVRELATGMSDLSPIAHVMGLSMEETAGILTPVIEIFGSGSEAAIALKTGLLKLIDDSKPVAEALASIGVAQKDSNGNLRAGKDILADVGEAFKTVDENQKLFVASQLVGIQQAARMVTVFNDMDKAIAITNTALGSAGSASAEVALRLESAEVKLERFKTGFDNLAIAVGNKFKLAATDVVGGAVDIENALQGIVENGGLETLSDAFEGVLSDIALTLTNVANNLPEAFSGLDFSGLLTSLEGLSGAVGDVFKALAGEDFDINTVDGLEIALQAVVDAVTSLTNLSAGIIEVLPKIFEAIGDLAVWLNDLDPDTIVLVGEALGALLVLNVGANIVSGFAGVATGMASLATVNWAGIASGAASAATALAPLLAVGAAGAAGWTVGSWLNDGINDVVQTFTDNQTLGGLVYDWINGEPENFEMSQELKDKLASIPKTVQKSSDETSVIPFSVDKDNTLSTSVDVMTDKVKLALAKLQSGENIANLKFEAEVDVANIEAKTAQVKAALELQGLEVQATTEKIEAMYSFNSDRVISEANKITAAFEASASTIGSLSSEVTGFAGLLGNTDLNVFDRMDVENFTQQALDQQQMLIDSQVALTKAQTSYIEIQNNKLQSGDALIRIDSTGLEPALEQVLWSIMEKVQLKVAMEQSELLLGLNLGVI